MLYIIDIVDTVDKVYIVDVLDIINIFDILDTLNPNNDGLQKKLKTMGGKEGCKIAPSQENTLRNV